MAWIGELFSQDTAHFNVNTKRPSKMPWHFSDWWRWIVDPNALWLSDHSMSTLTLYHTDDECVVNNLPEVLLESCDVLEVWISVFTHFIRTPCLSEPIAHPAGAVRLYGRSSEPVSLLSLAATHAFYACLSLSHIFKNVAHQVAFSTFSCRTWCCYALWIHAARCER